MKKSTLTLVAAALTMTLAVNTARAAQAVDFVALPALHISESVDADVIEANFKYKKFKRHGFVGKRHRGHHSFGRHHGFRGHHGHHGFKKRVHHDKPSKYKKALIIKKKFF